MDDQRDGGEYENSLLDPERFWAEEAGMLSWFRPWDTTLAGDFSRGQSRWFLGGKLNAAYNCLDRHLDTRAGEVAIYYEGDLPSDARAITYRELYSDVSRFASVLKSRGMKKGDRVCVYMPMIPEAVVAMLACARIGAIHSVVFGGFSAEALSNRIQDADCAAVVTVDGETEEGKQVHYKGNVDAALAANPGVHTVIVLKRAGVSVPWKDARDVWYAEVAAQASPECPCEEMDSNDPLFALYTSGSTDKPKGLVHSTGGYLVHVASTFRRCFGYQDGEVVWCTANLGWITGHSYAVYGPLANGATIVLAKLRPDCPSASRAWEIVDRYGVSIFYTTPYVLRMLKRHGNEPVKRARRETLRVLGCVGEPLKPDVWEWYFNVVGDARCPIIDTWWQTETGGIMIAPTLDIQDNRPGYVGRPIYGVSPVLLDTFGAEFSGDGDGFLFLRSPWPGMALSVLNDHDGRFIYTYFGYVQGMFFTGDGAGRDDGQYRIYGRADDVLKIKGERFVDAGEVEAALTHHPAVREAVVVGFPDTVKGQGIMAYVTLLPNYSASDPDRLKEELSDVVRRQVGEVAVPDAFWFVSELLRTRTGKIARGILRRAAAGENDMGDMSIIANPEAVTELVSP